MHAGTRKSLLGYSFPTDLIAKIGDNRHTVELLKQMSASHLAQCYSEAEVELITRKLKRKPISQDVIDSILILSDGACSYCKNGLSTQPYEIHHIIPHC